MHGNIVMLTLSQNQATSSYCLRASHIWFSSLEVKNPTLQIDSNLELKRGKYDESK